MKKIMKELQPLKVEGAEAGEKTKLKQAKEEEPVMEIIATKISVTVKWFWIWLYQ